MSSTVAGRDHGIQQDCGNAPAADAGGKACPTRLDVLINGEGRTTSAATLAELLVETGYGAAKVATALNGEFVSAKARGGARLGDGDRIEIVAPRQGG